MTAATSGHDLAALIERVEDDPLPDLAKLDAALKAADFARANAGRLTDDELAEIVEAAKWARHNVPDGLDFVDLCTHNPINQVYFRAGLLACREYMARFVEQGGDTTTAQSIRANWWPSLGDDPGAPRLFDFNEIAEEHTGPNGEYSVTSKPITPQVEALPRAYQFLNARHPALQAEDNQP